MYSHKTPYGKTTLQTRQYVLYENYRNIHANNLRQIPRVCEDELTTDEPHAKKAPDMQVGSINHRAFNTQRHNHQSQLAVQ